MNKEELLNLAEEDLMEALNYLYDYGLYNLVNEYDLKERIKEELNENVSNYNLIDHLLEGLKQDSETSFYNYDMSMGTLESITPINSLIDLEDLLIDHDSESEF